MVLSVYECESKQMMIKYYHTSLEYHPKRTLIEAANAGYLKGCPGLTSAEISKYVSVKDATEMGHMKQNIKAPNQPQTGQDEADHHNIHNNQILPRP